MGDELRNGCVSGSSEPWCSRTGKRDSTNRASIDAPRARRVLVVLNRDPACRTTPRHLVRLSAWNRCSFAVLAESVPLCAGD